MGMSTHVVGFKPPDEKFMKMLAAWKACEAAGVDPPKDVRKFFNDGQPDEAGVEVVVKATEWHGDEGDGFEVDLRTIDPDVKIIRFFNSW